MKKGVYVRRKNAPEVTLFFIFSPGNVRDNPTTKFNQGKFEAFPDQLQLQLQHGGGIFMNNNNLGRRIVVVHLSLTHPSEKQDS